MTPDDPATLAGFDDFLDALVGRNGADGGDLDHGLVETARRLHETRLAPAADPTFARNLRRALLSRRTTAPFELPATRSLSQRTSAPPARTWATSRWWPRLELAATALVVLVLAASLGGWDAVWTRWHGTGRDIRIAAPRAWTAPSQIASPSAATPTAGPAPSTRFAVGATVYVAQPRVALREGPSFEAQAIAMLPQGTPLLITGPSQEGQGVVWWSVGDPATGNAGFVVESGLSVEPPAPSPTPTPANAGPIDPSSKVEVSVTIDADGLLAGAGTARQQAIERFREVLAPYATCRVGFAETFGYSDHIAEGVAIAKAVNALLKQAFPEMFDTAVLNDFANVGEGRGHVDVDLYFYRGCVIRPATPQAVAATPTTLSGGTVEVAIGSMPASPTARP